MFLNEAEKLTAAAEMNAFQSCPGFIHSAHSNLAMNRKVIMSFLSFHLFYSHIYFSTRPNVDFTPHDGFQAERTEISN